MKKTSLFALLVLASTLFAAPMQPRSYSRGVKLIAGTKPECTVICPAAPEWQTLGKQLAGAIEELGTTDVPVLRDTDVVSERLGQLPAELTGRSLIFLGDVNTNRALFDLYANYYTVCDGRYPGQDGYVLRTMVRPFGREVNYQLVGAHTLAGAKAGVEALIGKFRALKGGSEVELPYTLHVQPGEPMTELLGSALEYTGSPEPFVRPEGTGHRRDAVYAFSQNAHLYFYTGKPFFAERARDWMLYMLDYSDEEIKTNDYDMENLATAWRRVSMSPVFSTDELQRIDQRMYETFLQQGEGWWVQKDASEGIGNRHHSTGMFSWWTFLRVISDVQVPSPEARAHLEQKRKECRAFLDGMLRHYWDDLDDYQSADAIQNTASYALQSHQLDWYRNGMAHEAARRLMSQIDNMGWYAGIQGYGEALPGWERFTLNGGLLLGSCAFVYDKGEYLWPLEYCEGLNKSWGSLQPSGIHQFDTAGRLAVQEPNWLTGLQVSRLTPYRLGLLNDGHFLKTKMMDGFNVVGLKVHPLTADVAYDKLVIRSSSSPDSMYLLLQGMSGIALSIIDMNSIVRYTEQAKIWLVHNTGRRSLYYKNAVYISNGTNEEAIPAVCELLESADLDEVALVASRLPDYRGTNWTRNLLTLHDRFTVAIDQIRIEKAGQYMIACNWRTPGFAQLDGTAWRSIQDDVTFSLLPGQYEGLSSRRDPERDGATRPTVLRQNRTVDAQAGQQVVFENLLYTTGPARDAEYEMRRIAPGAVLIRIQGEKEFYLAAAGDRGIDLPGLASEAKVLLAAPKKLYMTGGDALTVSGTTLAAQAGTRDLADAEADKLQALLARWWAKSAPVGQLANVANQRVENAGQVPLWQQGGPGDLGGLVDGVHLKPVRNITGSPSLATDWILPVLIAEPRLAGHRGDSLVPRDAKSTKPTCDLQKAAEPVLSPLAGAEFTLNMPEDIEIGEIVLYGDAFGETSEPIPPASLDVELTFSSDGFSGDRRVRTYHLVREPANFNLYKAHGYLFERYAVRGLREKASAVRVRVLGGSESEMILTDLQIRTAAGDQARPTCVRPVDLDGDGRAEVLTWTGQGDLAVVSADGTPWWRTVCPEGIVTVDAWDLDNDGTREIFVSRTDRQAAVYNLDGSIRWLRDYREMKAKTDGHFFCDGTMIYGMASWQPKTEPEPEVIFTGYFFSSSLKPDGTVDHCFNRYGYFTEIRKIPEGLSNAGGLVMRSDIPWVGPVPMQWWSTETGKVAATCEVPNGPAVQMDVADFDGDGQAEALLASLEGIGLYQPDEPQRLWEHMTDAPPVGAGTIYPTDKGPASIVYGRQDGYVFVMGVDGTVLRSTVIDEPLRALTALRTAAGEPVILLATETGLRCLSFDDFTLRWRQPGDYQKLTLLDIDGQPRVLAVTTQGTLQAFGF